MRNATQAMGRTFCGGIGASAWIAAALIASGLAAAPSRALAAAASVAGPKPLDGVNVEAIETYSNPKNQQIDFGVSIWPLDPYYNGFGLSLAYAYYYNKTYSWQVIGLDYIYGVDKGLRSQLASSYNVQPQQIEQLNYVLTSNIQYVPAYGKFILLKDYIRYFRSALVAGPAFAVSNKQSSVGLHLAWRFEVYVNPTYSWLFQIRDVYVPSNIGNNLALTFGTSYAY